MEQTIELTKGSIGISAGPHRIATAELAQGANRNVRYRTDGREIASQPVEQQTLSVG